MNLDVSGEGANRNQGTNKKCDIHAKAAKRNNPEAIVFQKDCRELLKEAKCGRKATNYTNLPIPSKGEVDLLCGGPPCQVNFKMSQSS